MSEPYTILSRRSATIAAVSLAHLAAFSMIGVSIVESTPPLNYRDDSNEEIVARLLKNPMAPCIGKRAARRNRRRA